MANLTKEQVREALKIVYDPELGVNIVDLGLVYDIAVDGERVNVTMTLTTPGCPLHDTIVGGVRRALQDKMNGEHLSVDVVWEPRWTPDMMSDAAREQLDVFGI